MGTSIVRERPEPHSSRTDGPMTWNRSTHNSPLSTRNARARAQQLLATTPPAAAKAAEDARNWASPRVATARTRGIEYAAPRIHDAAIALAPQVDRARDMLVDSVIPRVVEATNQAATDAVKATDTAHDAGIATLHAVADESTNQADKARKQGKQQRRLRKQTSVSGGVKCTTKRQAKALRAAEKATAKSLKKDLKAARKAVAKTRRSERKHTGRNIAIAGLALAAVGAAGYYAWRKTQPKDDPWVTATGADFTSDLTANGTADIAGLTDPTADIPGDAPTSGAGSTDSGTVVPPRAVDLTNDSDHALGGMAERQFKRSSTE